MVAIASGWWCCLGQFRLRPLSDSAPDPVLPGPVRLLLRRYSRPLRFASLGVLCAALQLGLLALFSETTRLGAASNVVAFLISALVNFWLNSRLTWPDSRPRIVWLQLLGFTALIAITAVLNQSLFLLASPYVPYLIAGAAAIGATTIVKYAVADRWIFPRFHRRIPAPRFAGDAEK